MGFRRYPAGGRRLRCCTSRHCSGVHWRLRVASIRWRARHLISRRLCCHWASPNATRLLLRVCPTATELPSMLWTVAVKRPTEGNIWRAGKGG